MDVIPPPTESTTAARPFSASPSAHTKGEANANAPAKGSKLTPNAAILGAAAAKGLAAIARPPSAIPSPTVATAAFPKSSQDRSLKF